MKSVCVLTDGMAQFLDLEFEGKDLVHLMPVHVAVNGQSRADADQFTPHNLPHTRSQVKVPDLVAPPVDDYVKAMRNLSSAYRSIIVVSSSSGLTDCNRNARAAAEQIRGGSRVEVVDTGTIGIGQGILAAAAAVQAASGKDVYQIKKYLLGVSEEVYSVFCLRNMAYLERLGLIDASQAFIGEMLEVEQLFYLNNGTLIPVQKIRNSRHLVESMLEFVAEFDAPSSVALQQAATGYQQEIRTIRERLMQDYPHVGVNELALTLPIGALFGPQSLGLFLWEITV